MSMVALALSPLTFLYCQPLFVFFQRCRMVEVYFIRIDLSDELA